MKKNQLGIMTLPSYQIVCGLIAAGFLLAASASQAEVVHYRAKPRGSVVKIAGSSNVHDWTMESSLIGGSFEAPGPIDSTQADLPGVADGKLKDAKADVLIRVTSLKNGHWEGMDTAMENAMRASDYPEIRFHLVELTPKLPHTANTPFQFQATGNLSFNGATNTFSMPVSIESMEKGQLKISAADVPVKMTDYQVKPPVKAGLFVTTPDVKISFDWVVGLSKAAPAK